MTEFFMNVLVQSASAALGFVAGCLWMRENYIDVIRQLRLEIESLKERLCLLMQR